MCLHLLFWGSCYYRTVHIYQNGCQGRKPMLQVSCTVGPTQRRLSPPSITTAISTYEPYCQLGSLTLQLLHIFLDNQAAELKTMLTQLFSLFLKKRKAYFSLLYGCRIKLVIPGCFERAQMNLQCIPHQIVCTVAYSSRLIHHLWGLDPGTDRSSTC